MIKKGNSKPYVISFENVGMNDVDIVGGKNASLGEMISKLTTKNIRVPNGFATTAQAFKDFIEYNQLTNKIQHKLSALDVNDIDMLTSVGSEIRKWICDAKFHKKFEQEIKTAFSCLENQSNESFAVRSSATAEDLPQASFAGQQETYLNICGIDNIFKSIVGTLFVGTSNPFSFNKFATSINLVGFECALIKRLLFASGKTIA